MDNSQATFLGSKQLPRELTAFEIEAIFTFTLAERQLTEDRRRPTLKLGLSLQIGFLRMSGRLLDAVPMVPPALWLRNSRDVGPRFHRMSVQHFTPCRPPFHAMSVQFVR